MRILVVHPGPQFSVADVYEGWMEGLTELGHRVHHYNLGDRLVFYDGAYMGTGREDEHGNPEIRKALSREEALGLAAYGILSTCYQFWPQLVIIISAFYVPDQLMDIMRDRGAKVIIIHTESPYQDDEQLARAAHADINILNDPVNLKKYLALGKPAYYLPHAYRPTIHCPGPGVPELESDFAFIGTGFPSRVKFFEDMNLDGIDVLLGGNWQATTSDSPLRKYLAHDLTECVDNELTARIYRSSRVGLNLYRREAEEAHLGEGWAMGPREVEMAACGLFFIRDPRGESDRTFPMLPVYRSPEEASDLIRWWLDHDDQREEAALKARAAIRGRTFTNHAKQLLRWVERL